MRRISVKSKKGKAEKADAVSDSESAQPEEEQGNGESNVAVSEGESAASEDAKANSKRKTKRGKKKQVTNSEADDGGSEAKKKKRDASEEQEETKEAEEFEVHSIVDMKQNRGKRQFKIRWKGYGPEGDTWENEDSLSCPEIIKKYLEDNENKDEGKSSKKRGAKTEESKTPKKKQKTAKKGGDNEVNNEEEGKEYEVDKVMEVHFKKNGTREFLIHWKGFSHKDDSWEPEKNLNCPELIEKFMSRVEKAKTTGSRELRMNPAHTDRFTLNMSQAGRRLSRRNQGKQRATYHGYV